MPYQPRSYNSNRNFNNGGYNQGQNFGQAPRAASPPRKHSGAKFKSRDKNGNPCTTGWNKSKFAGFVKFLCVVTDASKSGETQYGKWISVMVKVQRQMDKELIVSGMMNPDTGRVNIQSMGIVINPQAPNGGYCGKKGKR
jgi:hypothetical protein